jgi:hypothetical protein
MLRTRYSARRRRSLSGPLNGNLGTHEKSVIITTGDSSAGAATETSHPNAVPGALMNDEHLDSLLAEHFIGREEAEPRDH